MRILEEKEKEEGLDIEVGITEEEQ